ncbi:FGGY-family carbohydrate kinase [Amycolatopsis minnesotensis]|uniref:FGGY-family carbohydrate kinase n=1 Tax=Amycolatopsis minnesotensis TaxID=337894 RepID=A0ABP5C952_9PSEU
MEPIAIGLDFATSAVRARCVTATGETLATASVPLPAPEHPEPGHREQDAAAWWPSACRALGTALGELPAGTPVAGLAITATSGTVVAVDRAGTPVGPALMYDDRRQTAAARDGWAADEARWRALGVQPSVLSTVGRLSWLTGHHPGAVRFCHTADLIGWYLCGEPVAADWSHTLKAGYDTLRGEWAEATLAAAGVPLALLPEVRAPTTAVGTVSAKAAAETGLPAGTPVLLGMSDGCTAQLATGAAAPGQFVSVLGTTLVVKGVSERLLPDPTGAVYSHRHPDGQWLPGGASNTGGEALAAVPHDRLAGLDSAAAAHGPATVVSYPLRRNGERFPFVAPRAEGFTLGEPRDEVDSHRAALEGVAFCERLALDHLRGLGLDVAAPLLTAGGGNRSEVWLRIRADVLGMPLRVAGDADSSFGAALLAASGTLHTGLAEATGAMVRPGHVIEPSGTRLEDSYQRFRAELARRGWLGQPDGARMS